MPQSSPLSTASSANRAATVWADRHLNPHRASAIKEHAGHSFLDVGCGNGRYVLHFADDYSTAGVDLQPYPQWKDAPERFRSADASCLPFADQSVDTVVSFETLEHVPDPEAVLREFHRVARQNIIISVPNCELPSALENSRLAFFHYTDRSHVNFFTRDSLADTLRTTGFTPERIDLINACPVQPLLQDLLQLPSLLTRIVGKLARQNAFPMTILAVAARR
ncbi:MAG: methyltransferase domain-containing protein [Fuerstiella sp.]